MALLFAAEFIALFLSLKLTTASHAIVFVYTAPFFVGLGLVAFPHERLRPVQWIGMALAFVGVAVGLLKTSPGVTLYGDALALLAGAFWGATTVVLKATKLRSIDATKILLYQTVVGAIFSAIYALAIGEPLPSHISALTALSLFYQSVYVVGFTYLIWFWLLTTYRAAELSAFTFTAPIIGVFAGWLILGDQLTLNFLVAVALVAAGISDDQLADEAYSSVVSTAPLSCRGVLRAPVYTARPCDRSGRRASSPIPARHARSRPPGLRAQNV